MGKRLCKVFLLKVFLERSCIQDLAHSMDFVWGMIFLPSSVTKKKENEIKNLIKY